VRALRRSANNEACILVECKLIPTCKTFMKILHGPFSKELFESEENVFYQGNPFIINCSDYYFNFMLHLFGFFYVFFLPYIND